MQSKILLIEDEGPLLENVAEVLRLKGYQVITATNGRDGISLACLEKPDLIICDIMMPYATGYEVLEVIRDDQILFSTPFIFLTAKAQLTDLRQGMNRGADDYLTKPFTLRDLIDSIESRLTREQRRVTTARPGTNYLTTIRGRDGQGYMTLQAKDCLYFLIEKGVHCVLHPLGTFQIDLTFEELTAKLDPMQFFRVNRHAIIHRKIVQKYAYWEKGKYCLYVLIGNQLMQVVLPRARFSPFKDWLSMATIPSDGPEGRVTVRA